MANITPQAFDIQGLSILDINALYEALTNYVYRDGTAGLEGAEKAKFVAAYELHQQLATIKDL